MGRPIEWAVGLAQPLEVHSKALQHCELAPHLVICRGFWIPRVDNLSWIPIYKITGDNQFQGDKSVLK